MQNLTAPAAPINVLECAENALDQMLEEGRIASYSELHGRHDAFVVRTLAGDTLRVWSEDTEADLRIAVADKGGWATGSTLTLSNVHLEPAIADAIELVGRLAFIA